MNISKESRELWEQNSSKRPFLIWMQERVKINGLVDLDALYTLAKEYGITKTYDSGNAGQKFMWISKALESRVPPHVYLS